MTGFLIFVTVIVVLLAGFVFWPARTPASRPVRRQSSSFAPAQRTPSARPQGLESNVLLDAHPGVQEIAQLPPALPVAPKLLEQLDADLIAAVRAQVAGVKPMPLNHVRLMQLLGNPESAPSEINALIASNPVLSARILQTVNSPLFGLSDKITSVGRAMTVLGYNSVRTLVLRESLNAVVPGGSHDLAELYNRVWAHSAAVSACASYLGRNLFKLPDYELGTIGLLHDIGKYFIHLFAASAPTIGPLPGILEEDATRGLNHAALGSAVAANWQLSEIMVQTIGYHHHPIFAPPEAIPEACRKQSFVVCLSDLVCKSLGHGVESGGADRWPIRPEYFELFGLRPDLQGIVSVRLMREIEQAHATVQAYVAA
jgi:putative nucleotidyltransferase with HDIG domain